jgi:hypothetical protein
LLRELGCGQAHGCLIARPLVPQAATAHLRARAPRRSELQPA